MWNEAAEKTYQLLRNGEGLPLSPEHIKTTKKAFPVDLEEYMAVVVSNNHQLCAAGFVGGRPVLTWVSRDDPRPELRS